ncbi:integrin beta pat-3-like isoform X2 [Hyposmocoma kahamanoa]|uniref:integrin beta pat-3-like isoform X2 n=1 Tax=Hyposmocoma kahamanoa TaxID=1477025 RepID=UPI000E6D8071|nr:integrin beta pat-3-like isoform X2 [Hyposmocoma kahamanoa]
MLKCSAFVAWTMCSDHKTCGDCIKDSLQCQWCAMDDYNATNRCIAANETFNKCDLFENPQSEQTVSLNNNYSSGSNSTETNVTITQIRPQSYSIKLRPGQSVDFKINFKSATDYPADLYFLVDSSSSMKLIHKAIIDASKEIYEKMRSKTKNVYIGLGSFIDKNTLPFITKIDKDNPISSYRHLLSLTTDYKEFQTAVTNMSISKNVRDDGFTSGGFDALAQAMVCTDEIGWRKDSTKIIIYMSDALFSIAGDGKAAGITQPYDGKCYTKNGTYTKELEMDFPSIGIIRKLAADSDMTIIFIVDAANDIQEKYIQLTKPIKRSKHKYFQKFLLGGAPTAQFEGTIENTLSDIYENITRTLKLKDHMTATDRKFIEIKYNPDCTSKRSDNDPYLKSYCTVLHDKENTLTGTISLSKYYKEDRISVDIAIEGINERLTLDVQVINCDCAKRPEAKSKYCYGNGTKTCGTCHCDPDRYGSKCECMKNNNTLDDNAGCKSPGSDLLCSGRGICSCGICEKCSQGFNGKFCHCSDLSCTHKCYERGVCDCGKCKDCQGSWTGDDCNCSKLPCQMINGKECNGRGKCKCAECECEPIDSLWDARRSQNKNNCKIHECADCHQKQCQLLTPCACTVA